MHFSRNIFFFSMALPTALCVPADITKLKATDIKPIAVDLSKIDLSKLDPSKLDIPKIDFTNICKQRPSLCNVAPTKLCKDLSGGPIKTRWESMGAKAGVLGCSYETAPTVVAGVGSKQVFQHG